MFSTAISQLNTNFKQLFETCLLSSDIEKVDTLLANQTEAIFPAAEHLLRAFSFFDVEKTKVVILGQDPYHGVNEEGVPEADGLAFSVPNGTKMPPSLRNIFKEVGTRQCTDLSDWAEQGVLLINTAWTVVQNKPLSHEKIWKGIFIKFFKAFAAKCEGVVFLLWGKKAQEYMTCINTRLNRVYMHTHPSPLSRQPFQGCDHFNKANDYLQQQNKSQIVWNK